MFQASFKVPPGNFNDIWVIHRKFKCGQGSFRNIQDCTRKFKEVLEGVSKNLMMFQDRVNYVPRVFHGFRGALRMV